jgi:hypothetical protein
MSLPNPGMDFTPFDTLSAAELDDMVENIEALAAGTGLNDSVVTPDKRTGGFKVGSLASPAGTGNSAVTGVGFTPKMVVFDVVYTASDDARSHYSTGSMDASGNQYTASSLTTSTLFRTRMSTARCIAGYSSPGGTFTLQVAAAFVSMDADGFTVNFSASTTGYTILWKAYA